MIYILEMQFSSSVNFEQDLGRSLMIGPRIEIGLSNLAEGCCTYFLGLSGSKLGEHFSSDNFRYQLL